MRYKKFWIYLLIFIILNILLYVFIAFFNTRILFNKFNYTVNAHHYLSDTRINGGQFDLLRALGQYDAQWYLKIASEGYPRNPQNINLNQKNIQDGLSYAFFPLYPLVISTMNILIKNIELSAFIVANFLLLANFTSLYFVVKSFYNKNIALKTIFLLFFFPFSIFYRSYFTEGLFLFLLIWFSYFLIKKNWILSAVFLSLLSITRPNGIFFVLLLLVYLAISYYQKGIRRRTLFIYLVISFVCFIGWLIFCYLNTGNPFYFVHLQSLWYNKYNLLPILYNLNVIFYFFKLAPHSFHSSQIEVLTILITGMLLVLSRKKLKPELWFISFILWIVPLLTKDTMSFTRYQIVSFPLFVYLAMILQKPIYLIVFSTLCAGLFLLSLVFVNWHWVG